ncbi:MAG: hypothetical protein AAF721_07260, partial [Myxococcota bacterium]
MGVPSDDGESYRHTDGTPLVCEPGAHGIDPDVPLSDAQVYLHALPDQPDAPLVLLDPDPIVAASQPAPNWVEIDDASYTSDEAYPSCIDPLTGEQSPVTTAEEAREILCGEFPSSEGCQILVSREHQATVDTAFDVPIISFGKVCWYPSNAWEDLAPQWRENLEREAELLLTAILDLRRIIGDFVELSNSVVGWTSSAAGRFKAWLGGAKLQPCPTDAELTALRERINDVIDNELTPSSIEAHRIFDAGLEFMRIDREIDDVRSRFDAHRRGMIRGAESAAGGLEFVEWAAFEVVNLGAEVYAFRQPLKEVAYKLGIALARAGARGAGEALAGGRFVVPALTRLGQLAPQIIAGAIVKALKLDKVFGERAGGVANEGIGWVFDMVIFVA